MGCNKELESRRDGIFQPSTIWITERKNDCMPEVQVPEATQAAPSYRLDVELHELLMKPPEQPRLLPPPPSGKEQTLPTPVFPQHPELMNAPDEDYFPK